MAEVVDDIIKTLNGTNGTDTESVIKIIPATTEGMLIANTSLAVMSLVPIFFASFRSVELHIKNKVGISINLFLNSHYANILISIPDEKRNTRVHGRAHDRVYDRKRGYDVSSDFYWKYLYALHHYQCM